MEGRIEEETMNEYWVFTFGCGQKYAGFYVKITGTFSEAREKMFKRYGNKWAFQYSWEQWERMKNSSDFKLEEELEVIE